MPATLTIAVILSSMLQCVGGQQDTPSTSLEEIRWALAETEAEATDFKCRYLRTLVSTDGRVLTSGTIKTSNDTIDWSFAGKRSHLETNESWVMGDETTRELRYLQAYDGRLVRINHYGQVGNVWDRIIPDHVLRPTCMGLPHEVGTSIRLVELMSFDPDDYTSNSRKIHNRILRWKHAEYIYHGTESIDDHTCHHVELRLSDAEGNQTHRLSFILRADKGYQIHRCEYYDLAANDRLPILIAEVLAWQTLRRDVSIPALVRHTSFGKDLRGMWDKTHTIEYRLDSVAPSSEASPEFFEDIEMPSEVYVIKGDETERWVDGKRSDQNRDPGN